MNFISVAFIVFFVIVLLLYFIIPKKFQWILLLIASYFFYMYASPELVIFLLLATVTTYLSSLCMGKVNSIQNEFISSHKGLIFREERKKIINSSNCKKRLLLFGAIVITIGILVFVKYTNFFISSINVFGLSFSELGWLILPLGISFYTFQSLGYSIDVYRGSIDPEKNIFKYALFVSFFPQISMGPIGRYNQLAPQLFSKHSFDGNNLVRGLERMLWGFFKKIVIANNVGLFVDVVYSDISSYSGVIIILATIAYAIQMYADFTGFVDIATGAAQVMGIKLAENFNRPYFSRSIPEYWRRWHITLGAWFKDYVFYSLQRTKLLSGIGMHLHKANRKHLAKIIPASIALLITWITLGLWHGSEWHYAVFGLYYGLIMISGIVLAPVYDKLRIYFHVNTKSFAYQLFQIMRTMSMIVFGYIIFRVASMTDFLIAIKQILFSTFTGGLSAIYHAGSGLGLSILTVIVVMIGCLLCLIISSLEEWHSVNIYDKLANMKLIVRWGILYFLLFAIVLFGEFGTVSFIYFQF